MLSRCCSENNIRSRPSSAQSFTAGSSTHSEETLADVLLSMIQPSVIIKLKKCFFYRLSKSERAAKHKLDRKIETVLNQAALDEGIDFSDIPSNDATKTLWIDKDNFILAIEKIFEGPKYTPHAEVLFRELDLFNTGKIWWNDVLDRLVDHGASRTRTRAEFWKPFQEDRVVISQLYHCKNESIVKVVHIENGNTFCFAVFSKNGKVGLYDGVVATADCLFAGKNLKTSKLSADGTYLTKQRPLSEYDLFVDRTGKVKRTKVTWITDACYFHDCKVLVASASDRSLIFYDAATLVHYPLYLIEGLPNIITYMTYSSSRHKDDVSRLFYGDDHGSITILTFKQSRVSLFQKNNLDKLNCYHWTDIETHTNHISIQTWSKVHTRYISRIFYEEDSELVLSCSNEGDSSIVMRSRTEKVNDAVFHVLRGVTSFHYVKNILAAGSRDGLLRLFDPFLTSRPFAVLENQVRSPIVDVAIITHLEIVVALHRNLVVNIWDIYDEKCLQSVSVKFPFIGVLGKKIEFGANSIYHGPPRKIDSKTEENIKEKHFRFNERNEDNIDCEYRMNDEINPDEEGHIQNNKNRWNKSEIFITCCDHIAVLKFNAEDKPQKTHLSGERREKELNDDCIGTVLPPPERCFRLRKPSVWETEGYETIQLPSTSHSEASSRRSSFRENDRLTDIQTKKEVVVQPKREPNEALDVLLEKYGLRDVFNTDFAMLFNLKNYIGAKMMELEGKQEKMKTPVVQCAPYMALDLAELDEIKFSAPMPITERMKRKSGIESFIDAHDMMEFRSCFSMSTPRTVYSCSTSRSALSQSSNSGAK